MNLDSVSAGLLSLWMGFAIALQVSTQVKADARARAHGWTKRRLAARAIFFVVGIGGMLGLASLLGSSQLSSGPEFAVGLVAGIAAYVAAFKLGPT